MLIKKILFFCLMFVLVGCTLHISSTATPEPFAYSHDPGTIVIYAYPIHYPPRYPELDHEFRDAIPDLRIWGDGKTILVSTREGQREILMGTIGEAQFSEIFSTLNQEGILGMSTPVLFHGSRYHLEIYLLHNVYVYEWQSHLSPLYQKVKTILLPYLSPYIPTEARLYASRIEYDELSDPLFGVIEPKGWLEDFGISLATVPKEGLDISGSILKTLWEETNTSPYELRFREGNQVYWVKLEGLSEELFVTPTSVPNATAEFPYPLLKETPSLPVVTQAYPPPL